MNTGVDSRQRETAYYTHVETGLPIAAIQTGIVGSDVGEGRTEAHAQVWPALDSCCNGSRDAPSSGCSIDYPYSSVLLMGVRAMSIAIMIEYYSFHDSCSFYFMHYYYTVWGEENCLVGAKVIN